jgi:hypothetical protein
MAIMYRRRVYEQTYLKVLRRDSTSDRDNEEGQIGG